MFGLFAPRTFDPHADDIKAVIAAGIAEARRTKRDVFPNAPRRYPDWMGVTISINTSVRSDKIIWRLTWFETKSASVTDQQRLSGVA